MSTVTSVTMNCDYRSPNAKVTCAKTEDVETVTYSHAVEGQTTSHEVDLCAQHRDQFNKQLGTWDVFSRAVKPVRVQRTGNRSTSRSDAAEIRAWAKSTGRQVPERGRLPALVKTEYAMSQNGGKHLAAV